MNAYPALPAFAIALVALFAKTTVTSVAQVIARNRAQTYLMPEDAGFWGFKQVDAEAPFVHRFANVWRNDTENLPLFLALALSYTLLGATLESAQMLFGLYVLIRYIHTLIFLRGLQPWRAIFWISGMLVCWTIALKTLSLALPLYGSLTP